MAKGSGGGASSGRGTGAGGGYSLDRGSLATVAQASAILGKELSLSDLGRLIGAPAGSSLSIQSGTNGRGQGITVQAFGKEIGNMNRVIFRRDGQLIIFNNQIQKASGVGPGFAKRSLELQKRAARRLGVSRIEAVATGGYRQVHNGYYTLPRLGYNGNLKASWLSNAPKRLQGAITIQQLFKRKGGAEWWRRHGRSFDAYINL